MHHWSFLKYNLKNNYSKNIIIGKYFSNVIQSSISNPLKICKNVSFNPKTLWEVEELFNLADKGIKNKEISFITSRMFRTRTHREIFGLLSNRCNNLLEGDFKNTVGVSTRTLCGANGIGKSTALMAFIQLCPTLYGENLIPIYLSYNNIDGDDIIRQRSLGQILADELNVLGLGTSSEDIHDTLLALRNKNRRLLLVVDEIDRLFACKSDFEYGRRTIGDLTAIAENRFGVSSALICGSSANLPELVSNKACSIEELRIRFPLVNHVGDMNGSKFEEIRVHSSLPFDGTVIDGIIGEEISPVAKNLVVFLAGTNASRICKFMKALYPIVRKGKFDQSFAPNNLVEIVKLICWNDSDQGTCGKRRMFFEKIINALKVKNSKLFEVLVDNNGNFNWDKIVDVDWNKFEPLFEEEVIICNSIAEMKEVVKQTRFDLKYLADHSWLILGDRFAVYPVKFIDILIQMGNAKNNPAIIAEEIKRLFHNPILWPRLVKLILTFEKNVENI